MADNPTAMRSHSRRPLCNLLRWHTKLLKQGYVAPMLKSSLHKLYGCHHNLVDHCEISISQIIFYVDVYFLSITANTFYQTWLYIWITRQVSYKKHELLTFTTHSFFVGSVLFIILVLCVVFLFCLPLFCVQCCMCLVSNVVCVLCPMLYVSCVQCCMCFVSNVACVSSVRPWFLFVMFVLYISSSIVFTFLVPCFDVHYDFGMKTIFRSSYPHLFVWGFMSHLWYLCLLRIEVSHILSYHMSVHFQFRVVISA
jgi:hypothetical protein